MRDPDLAVLPVPHFFEHEGGAYMTAGAIVARDPETGRRNWSIARVRPLGGARALVGIAPNHHLAVLARAAAERGERLPIAVAIGLHPALLVAACLYLRLGEDELEVAGALLGERVELARCRTVPLEVPAHAELVLEGHARRARDRGRGTRVRVPRHVRELRPGGHRDVQLPDAAPRRRAAGHRARLPPRARAARSRRDRGRARARPARGRAGGRARARDGRRLRSHRRRHRARPARTGRRRRRDRGLLRSREPDQARDGRRRRRRRGGSPTPSHGPSPRACAPSAT